MSGVISRGNWARLLQDGVSKVFDNELAMHEEKWPMMFEDLTSKKSFEVSVQEEGFGRSKNKFEGDDVTFDSSRQGYTPKFVHSVLGLGYIVTEETIEDELYGVFSEGAKRCAKALTIGKEIDGANILNNGFDTDYTMIDGDGQPLFSTAHPRGPSGGTFSNRLAVDADLSESSLEDMQDIIMNAEDNRGLPARLMSRKLVVRAGTNAFNAQRILGSVLQNDTGNNATNAIRDMNLISEGFMSSPYLTNSRAWFVLTDCPNGLIGYNRRPFTFGEDNAFTSGNVRFKATTRYSFGWLNARSAYGSQGV